MYLSIVSSSLNRLVINRSAAKIVASLVDIKTFFSWSVLKTVNTVIQSGIGRAYYLISIF